jgi:hypothetical protein
MAFWVVIPNSLVDGNTDLEEHASLIITFKVNMLKMQ